MGLINSKLKCEQSKEQSVTSTDGGILSQNTARYYQEPYKVRMKLCRTGQTIFHPRAKIRIGLNRKKKKEIWRMTRDGFKYQIYCEHKGRNLFLTPERTDGRLQLKDGNDSSKRYRDYEFYSDRHDNSGTKIRHLATSKVLGTKERGRKLVLVLEEDSMGEYFNIEEVK